jgi:outer membrane lipoprotein-sorting protein
MINSVTLLFHQKVLRKMSIVDQFGKQNQYQFYDVKLEPKLAPSLFELDIPKSVDVIDNRNGTNE